jgi:hypothetical protein
MTVECPYCHDPAEIGRVTEKTLEHANAGNLIVGHIAIGCGRTWTPPPDQQKAIATAVSEVLALRE